MRCRHKWAKIGAELQINATDYIAQVGSDLFEIGYADVVL